MCRWFLTCGLIKGTITPHSCIVWVTVVKYCYIFTTDEKTPRAEVNIITFTKGVEQTISEVS